MFVIKLFPCSQIRHGAGQVGVSGRYADATSRSRHVSSERPSVCVWRVVGGPGLWQSSTCRHHWSLWRSLRQLARRYPRADTSLPRGHRHSQLHHLLYRRLPQRCHVRQSFWYVSILYKCWFVCYVGVWFGFIKFIRTVGVSVKLWIRMSWSSYSLQWCFTY